MLLIRILSCLTGTVVCLGQSSDSWLDAAVYEETCEAGDCDISFRQLRGERVALDQGAPSCAAFGCGHFVKGRACQCTPKCSHFGNCCADFEATCSKIKEATPSCAAYGCSTQYVRGHPCQCTPKCEKFGNCCPDFKSMCIKREVVTTAPTATANVSEDVAAPTDTASATAPAAQPIAAAAPAAAPDAVAAPATASAASPAPVKPVPVQPSTAPADVGDDTWGHTVDGIVRTKGEKWIEGSGTLDKNATCAAPKRGDECWTAVTWAMTDGIFAHPEWWPELQPGASSFEEFQRHQHLMKPDVCPQPCTLRYPTYEVPTYRSTETYAMKGISYGASPLKTTGVRLTDDDFMTDITGAMWDSWGRGDLDVLESMGVNTLRMYGNDLNYSHRSFLDGALKRGMDVIVGLSDWGFIQGPDPCDKNGWHCFQQVYDAYTSNLLKGFTIKNYTMYHPALKALIISNEPDLKVHPRQQVCRAMVTSLDAILQAEKDLNVTENPIAFTVTFSFAAFGRKAPGLGQMEELYDCVKHPTRAPTNYTPKNDILTAYKQRWVNSFNTAAPGHVVQELMLDKYKKSIFQSKEIKLPIFIGEYHSVNVGAKDDLPILVHSALSSKYPFYLGYNFFEFSVRYDKGGSEEKFGMFAYGNCPLIEMNYSGQVYTIWNLVPAEDKLGYPLSKALQHAYGKAEELPKLRSAPCMAEDEVLGVS